METIEQMMEEGRALALYQESEQADQKATENIVDALWQSIYDVCKLIALGIIEDDEEDEDFKQALLWLKKTQSATSLYQEQSITF